MSTNNTQASRQIILKDVAQINIGAMHDNNTVILTLTIQGML